MLSAEKSLLRNKINAVRNGYQKDWLGEKSRLVSGHLAAWELFKQAKRVAGYLAFGNEVDIDSVLRQALAEGKEVFVPSIDGSDEMRLIRLESFSEIVTGKYGIRTVKRTETCCLDAKDLDLILTPGLAFTLQGGRMGLGKGYYDRFLAKSTGAVKIGVTLTPQIADALPLEPHDALMDYIVTEEGIKAV